MLLEISITHTEALTNAVYTTLVGSLWCHQLLTTGFASPPCDTGTHTIQAGTISRAIIGASFLGAEFTDPALFAHTSAIDSRAMLADRLITVSTFPSGKALTSTVNASTLVVTHLGVTCTLGAILLSVVLVTLTSTIHTLAVVGAVIWTSQRAAISPSVVCCASTHAVGARTAPIAILRALFRSAILALEAS